MMQETLTTLPSVCSSEFLFPLQVLPDATSPDLLVVRVDKSTTTNWKIHITVLCVQYLCVTEASCKHPLPFSLHLLQISPCIHVWQWCAHTPIHTAWDDYGHDLHMLCTAETMYTNGFNLCWLPTVFMSHSDLVRAPCLLQGECTFCSLSD